MTPSTLNMPVEVQALQAVSLVHKKLSSKIKVLNECTSYPLPKGPLYIGTYL